MSWKKTLTSLVTASAVLFGGVTAVADAQEVTTRGSGGVECRDYAVLVIPGTTEIDRSSTNLGMLHLVTDQMANQAGDKFLIQAVDYPASVGGLIAPIYGGVTPFSDSVKEGIDQTLNYALEYKKRCPGIKFAMMGFSQGALVAGDATEIIGNDKVEGLSADDFIGSLLYADPRRARSQIDGVQVQREGSEKTIGGVTDIAMEGEGIFGYRKEFGAMTSKTVSFCTTTDVVCNISDKAREAADWVASLAEYNTGTNTDQMDAFQDIGFGDVQRDVASVTDDIWASPIFNQEELIANRQQNPASLVAMFMGFAALAPEFIENEPANAVAAAFGMQPVAQNGGNENAILKEGLEPDALGELVAALGATAATGGHGLYPVLPVSADGTTATQWGANWLTARMD